MLSGLVMFWHKDGSSVSALRYFIPPSSRSHWWISGLFYLHIYCPRIIKIKVTPENNSVYTWFSLLLLLLKSTRSIFHYKLWNLQHSCCSKIICCCFDFKYRISCIKILQKYILLCSIGKSSCGFETWWKVNNGTVFRTGFRRDIVCQVIR